MGKMMFNRAVIYGPGLLGASLMQAIRRDGLSMEVGAWARRPETRLACEGVSWCDFAHSNRCEAAEGADFIVICLPVEHIVDIVSEIREVLKPGCIVTDVGSTKSVICREAHAVLSGTRAAFVGSHPMAGSEKSGLENADPELFTSRAAIVTPLPDSDPGAVEKVVGFWSRLGMVVSSMSPERHDEIVANVSHLPHFLASALCSRLTDLESGWRNFAGGGLRDTTRVAAGDPSLWRSIAVHNREEILRAISGFEDELQRLKAALHNSDFIEVQSLLARGKSYRDRL